MERAPLLIVAGLPELARDARDSGVFPGVDVADTVSGLIRVFKTVKGSGPGGKVLPRDAVMVIADSLREDEAQVPLAEMLRKLTGNGYHVIIVSTTARGADLHRQFPKAGLLPVPVRLNDLLYAVNVFGFSLEPVANAEATGAPPRTSTPAGNAAATTKGGWGAPPGSVGTSSQEAPGTPSRPVAPNPPRQQPLPVTEPARPDEPRPAAVGGSGWGTTAPAPATERPARTESFRQTGSGRPVLFPAANPASGPAASPAANQAGGWGGQRGPVARVGSYASAPTPASRRGFVITIASAKGGVGKSSMTLNLGAFLGMRLRGLGKTVCVIDCSFQQGDASKYLGVFRPNINTIADDPSYMTRERILDGLVTKPEFNLSVLLGPSTPDEGNPININAQLYSEILDLLKAHFDYVLIDTPVAEKYHDIFTHFALKRADYIVVPVAPSFPTLHNNDSWLQQAVTLPKHAGGAGLDPSQIGIVLNREEDGIGCSVDDVRMTMARWNFLGSIPETKEWKLANNKSQLVVAGNFAELHQAFATVLYAATGEPVLMQNIALPEERGGVAGFIRKILGRDA
jgi:cellulose biosynthesis protein BcsQ